jgi:hypothetical protein
MRGMSLIISGFRRLADPAATEAIEASFAATVYLRTQEPRAKQSNEWRVAGLLGSCVRRSTVEWRATCRGAFRRSA